MSLNDNTNKIAAILAAANALPDKSKEVKLDTTLTQSGQAADAKTVGDRLHSLSDEIVATYAKKTEVPTKTSQLTNDSGFLTSHQDISGKQDKSTLEADVAAKGFTKNTGTYSKPAGGIPKADLAAAVQTSLGKADTALQSHQSLAAYRTAAAQDVIDSGKVDKVDGKGLSTNDYTAAAKAKVDAIPANPKYTDTVYDDAALKERIATIEGKESAWDAKSDFSGSYNDLTDKPTPLIGTTNELTPTQVYDAVSAGIPVKVQYLDSTYGLSSFTAFNVSESMNVIASNSIINYNDACLLAVLYGNKSNNGWFYEVTPLTKLSDIPTALPNPNALTFTGAVNATYDGSSAVTVEIPDGAGAWYVTLTPDDDGNITADRTMEEIEVAYQAGHAVYCILLYPAIIVIIPIIAPLTIHRANEQYVFCGVGTFDSKLYSFQFELTKNGWTLLQKEIQQKSDIPSMLPNPNSLTFTGAVTGSYNGSAAVTVNIPSAVTDDHINSLIDTKLGVIENGSY